jgi:hypothetical protein
MSAENNDHKVALAISVPVCLMVVVVVTLYFFDAQTRYNLVEKCVRDTGMTSTCLLLEKGE